MFRSLRFLMPGILLALAFIASQPGWAQAKLQILLPLGRVAYQTNERIDVSVVRTSPTALPEAALSFTVTGEDASKLAFTFPLTAVPVVGADARATEHLHLNGALLRPGKYTLQASAYDTAASTTIEVYSHIRQSNFRLLSWGGGPDDDRQVFTGENGAGLNMVLAVWSGYNQNANIRAGVDYMKGCLMSGGHQMDLRGECDWSDPYVLQGGEVRASHQTLLDRTSPNTIGAHFYDEPGLTWDGEKGPFTVPAQYRSYKGAFGTEAISWDKVSVADKASLDKWEQFHRWRESFMEAAWKQSAFEVNYIDPKFLSATQSVYGWYCFSDGYDFNITRQLPVTCGHTEYDSGPGRHLFSNFYAEFGHARDTQKPYWCLPIWNGNVPAGYYRLEQYSTFMTDLQGMAINPYFNYADPKSMAEADGMFESNYLMTHFGTVFTTIPANRGQVALLRSLSNNLYHVAESIKDNNYTKTIGRDSLPRLNKTYIAGKMLHVSFDPVVDQDILDGTVAANHKAILLVDIDYLDAKIISALEEYIANGGAVLVSDECKVQINGATKVGMPCDVTKFNQLDCSDIPGLMQEIRPFADALNTRFKALGIAPVMGCDNEAVITTRHGKGDIEYFFALNGACSYRKAGPTDKFDPLTAIPTTATLALPADGRPVYDAVRGGKVSELAEDAKTHTLTGKFRFGAGQLRIFARTARPIGGLQLTTPVVSRDYLATPDPITVTFSATLVDEQKTVLCGSAPLFIRVVDALGAQRYALYRPTDQGVCKITLPLAANDPAGKWQVTVRELITNKEATASFAYQPSKQCGAIAGTTPRAIFFGNDWESAFRFFRLHHQVTIVKGTGAYEAAAADRLVETLKPWNIKAMIVNAADVNKARPLSADEAKTWVGLVPTRAKAGDNGPGISGFDIPGSTILLGTPDDNPLIKFLADNAYLPYKPEKDVFPGRGRGYLSWQRNAISYGEETVTLVAYDASGMDEAVGTLYEAAAGTQPQLALDPPTKAAVTAATTAQVIPEMPTAWTATLPERATMIATMGTQLTVTTLDGSQATIDATGKVLKQDGKMAYSKSPSMSYTDPKTLGPEISKQFLGKSVVKQIATAKVGGATLTAVSYWGGNLQLFTANTLKAQQRLPQDIAQLAFNGDKLIVALADGRIVALATAGK